MQENVRLGRIAGVEVGMNWSVLVIFALIAVGLAAGRFPTMYPDLETAAYIAAGVVAGVIFFASLLAHEISHAVVARRNGVEVEGITLWMLGGVARLTGEAPDPGAELRIAGVGPLVSLLLAGAFASVAGLVDLVGAEGLVVGVLGWLAVINLVLGVFNLLPASPLDGGRLLRAFLWHRRNDRHSAAVTASRAGRGFGWFLVAFGFVQFVAGAGFGGLWLVLIGWFLSTAAAAEEQRAQLSGALDGVRVADVMTRDPVAAPADLSVDRFVDDYVFANRYSTFPLTRGDGRPVGLVTLSRVKGVARGARATTSVGDLACPLEDIAVVRPDQPVAELLSKMTQCADGRALVVDDDRLVGIVSPRDVMRHLALIDLRLDDGGSRLPEERSGGREDPVGEIPVSSGSRER